MSEVEIVVEADKESLAHVVAARLQEAIPAAAAAGRPVEIGLTGGSMGGATVAALVTAQERSPADLSAASIWWGDERFLPPGDPDRNDTQADEAGLGRLGIPTSSVHRVLGPDAGGTVDAAADAYAEAIRSHGAGGFEVLMLGVGPDGHVASLFPGHPAQLTTDAICVGVHGSPKPPPERVSLTFEAMARTREVWFLVAGEDKAEAVRDGIAGAPPERSSAAQVHGTERTVWFLDKAAARLLP